jgi:hypothetical protein
MLLPLSLGDFYTYCCHKRPDGVTTKKYSTTTPRTVFRYGAGTKAKSKELFGRLDK